MTKAEAKIARKEYKLQEEKRFVDEGNNRVEKFKQIMTALLKEADDLCQAGFYVAGSFNGSSLRSLRVSKTGPYGRWVRFI